MAQPWILAILSILVFFLFFLIFVRIQSKKQSGPPRELRRFNRKKFFIMAPLGYLIILFSLWEHNYWLAIVGVIVIFSTFWETFKPQTANEILTNYAHDPEYCGQCGYSLTGNVSGVCPECGWSIPQGSFQYQRSDWACWWKKWEIDYLKNWKQQLAQIGLITIVFAVLAIYMAVSINNSFTWILFAIITLDMIVNCIRIIAYARRQSSTAPLDERQD